MSSNVILTRGGGRFVHQITPCMHYMAMLYVIGTIFKEEFKETKTVALRLCREELRGHPRQGHAHPGDQVRELKKNHLKCIFSLNFDEI